MVPVNQSLGPVAVSREFLVMGIRSPCSPDELSGGACFAACSCGWMRWAVHLRKRVVDRAVLGGFACVAGKGDQRDDDGEREDRGRTCERGRDAVGEEISDAAAELNERSSGSGCRPVYVPAGDHADHVQEQRRIRSAERPAGPMGYCVTQIERQGIGEDRRQVQPPPFVESPLQTRQDGAEGRDPAGLFTAWRHGHRQPGRCRRCSQGASIRGVRT
jgi:hypothetical protein